MAGKVGSNALNGRKKEWAVWESGILEFWDTLARSREGGALDINNIYFINVSVCPNYRCQNLILEMSFGRSD